VNPIIREVSREQGMNRDTAWRTYRRLMVASEVKPADVEAMREAMQVLGKTVTDASLDHQTIEKAKGWAEKVKSGGGLSPAREAAGKALEAHSAETVRISQERKKEYARLLAEQSALDQQYLNAQHFDRELQALRQQTAPLLADIPDERLAELDAAADKKAAAA
jgi:Zn-dependent oligopeptidase